MRGPTAHLARTAAAALVVATACLPPPLPSAAEEPAPRRGVPSDRLPVLGTVGDPPAPSERLVVEVEPHGRLTMDGRTAYPDGFRKALRDRAAPLRGKDGQTALSLVIRADREAPWQAMRWLFAECAAPEAKVRRVYFAAKPEDGGLEGAFAAFLGDGDLPPAERAGSFHLRWWDVRDDCSPLDAFASLGERTPFMRGLNKFAAVTATPRMHTGLVLQTADALIRWGVEDVRLEGPAAETVPEFERAVKELPAESGRLSLVHGGAPVRAFGPKARAAPRIERVRGAPAGIFAERSLEKPEAKPAPETPVTIAGAPGLLPRLGVVGDLPPAEERIVIEVDQSGTVTVDGARADSAALDGILAKASRRLVDPAVPDASRLHVVLRLDRRLPWIVANRFFVLAGRQELMVTRILFAAMPEDGGPEGAVAAFVPITAESGNYRRKVREDRTLTILVGVALDFPDRFRMRHLLEHLRESRGPWRPEEPWLLEFRPRPDVPVGTVLEAFDMMLRWGADFVVFAGPPDDGRRVIRDLVATTPTASGGLLVAINRERVPPDSWNRGPGEPLPRIRGRMAGLTNPEPVIVIPAAPRPKEEEDE